MWDEATRNIMTIINGRPFVHLKGHVSKTYDVTRDGFMYFGGIEECSATEFGKACTRFGMRCTFVEDSIYITDGKKRVHIRGDGRVFIDGVEVISRPAF